MDMIKDKKSWAFLVIVLILALSLTYLTKAEYKSTTNKGNYTSIEKNLREIFYQRIFSQNKKILPNGQGRDISQPSSSFKIMPVGDSITYGLFHHKNGYRGYLKEWQKFIGNFEFVGPKISPAGGHYSIPGATIKNISKEIDIYVKRYNPDMILLMIGKNDVIYKKNSSEIITEIKSLIDKIYKSSSNPNLIVFIHELIPLGPPTKKAGMDRVINEVNSKLISEIAIPNLKKWRLVWVVPNGPVPVTEKDLLSDGIHPTDLGHQKIAFSWYLWINWIP